MKLRFLLFAVLAVLAVGATLSAQMPPHTLSVLVDGSKTPEQIPDDLAYHHFILAISEHQNLSELDFARREARLKPIGLSGADHDLCISALAGLREELDAITNARNGIVASGVTADAAFATLKDREDAAIATVRAALRAMSADGQSRLDAYIKTHVKQRISILGSQH